MRLLLDTHVLLWWLEGSSRLGSEGRQSVEAAENEVFVSSASIWEICIKQGVGRLTVPPDLLEQLELNNFTALSITPRHAVRAGALQPIHQDPFDRMLVAQAQEEQLILVTADAVVQQYPVQCLAV